MNILEQISDELKTITEGERGLERLNKIIAEMTKIALDNNWEVMLERINQTKDDQLKDYYSASKTAKRGAWNDLINSLRADLNENR